MPLWHSAPFEKSHQRARTPLLIPEVEVIGSGIVKVDGLLHELQAEDLRVEIDRALGVGTDCREMMETPDRYIHATS